RFGLGLLLLPFVAAGVLAVRDAADVGSLRSRDGPPPESQSTPAKSDQTQIAAAPEPPQPAQLSAEPPSPAPPPPGPTAPAPNEHGDVVPVYYGRDRHTEGPPERPSYTSERARRLELGRALVTVPKAHELPDVERPWTYRLPFTQIVLDRGREDPALHFT